MTVHVKGAGDPQITIAPVATSVPFATVRHEVATSVVCPAAIYMSDAEGRLTFYNEAAAELWGCHAPAIRFAPGALHPIGTGHCRCRYTRTGAAPGSLSGMEVRRRSSSLQTVTIQ